MLYYVIHMYTIQRVYIDAVNIYKTTVHYKDHPNAVLAHLICTSITDVCFAKTGLAQWIERQPAD